MEKKVFAVDGMSCQHCVDAITKAVKSLDGVKSVEVSLKAKKADVEFDPSKTSPSAIITAIEDQGFDAKSA
ncbi:MAG: copper ion binding protein [Elusimicrobiota bacterium]|jgi:copper chaperone|nr:copper ion binding protein [Elusimicrobiota bacterium]